MTRTSEAKIEIPNLIKNNWKTEGNLQTKIN